ncbi:MAG: hypothetical protein EBS86_15015 [Crocinitomicaceae bacterium]|nr:hypothetical protein [Crocinitomicaceae bacterium]
MKNKLMYTLALAILVIGFQGCKPEPKVLGPKASQIDGIAGNWELSKVDQIDVNVQLAFIESDTLLDVSDVVLDAFLAQATRQARPNTINNFFILQFSLKIDSVYKI